MTSSPTHAVSSQIVSTSPWSHTWNPIDRGGHFVRVARLQRVHHTQHLGSVATGRSRIGEDEAYGLLWVDYENTSDGECNSLLIDIGGILMIQHIVQICNLSLLVSNNWEFEI